MTERDDTGRDRLTVAQALAYAIEIIAGLPSRRSWSMRDMLAFIAVAVAVVAFVVFSGH